jgi:hypothetical protein
LACVATGVLTQGVWQRAPISVGRRADRPVAAPLPPGQHPRQQLPAARPLRLAANLHRRAHPSPVGQAVPKTQVGSRLITAATKASRVCNFQPPQLRNFQPALTRGTDHRVDPASAARRADGGAVTARWRPDRLAAARGGAGSTSLQPEGEAVGVMGTGERPGRDAGLFAFWGYDVAAGCKATTRQPKPQNGRRPQRAFAKSLIYWLPGVAPKDRSHVTVFTVFFESM